MRYAKNHRQKRQWFSSYIQSPMGKVKLSPQLSPQLSPYQSPMGKVKKTRSRSRAESIISINPLWER